jgi:hypothetical protein
MARYIDADATLDTMRDEMAGTGYQSIAMDVIKYAPTADVVEVKHGEWIEWWDDNYLSYCHKCSECGGYPLTKEETMHDEVLSAYCSHCGAKMDGRSDT